MANKILVARGTKARLEEIKSSLTANELVYATDTKELGVKKANGDIEYFMNAADIDAEIDNVNDLLGLKVDKVSGKGLSTEDYTTNEKNKLAELTVGLNVGLWGTATKTLALSDANKLFVCSYTNDQTLTVPTHDSVPFPTGTMITFSLISPYTVTFVGASGVTLSSMDDLVELKTRYAMASLIKLGENNWQLVGAL